MNVTNKNCEKAMLRSRSVGFYYVTAQLKTISLDFCSLLNFLTFCYGAKGKAGVGVEGQRKPYPSLLHPKQ